MNKTFCVPEYKCGLKDTFLQFIQYKKTTGRKERLFATVLKTFDEFCVLQIVPVESLNKDVVDSFLQVTEKRKLSSVHTYASVLRELGHYMRQMLGVEDAYITRLHRSKKILYGNPNFRSSDTKTYRRFVGRSHYSDCRIQKRQTEASSDL